MGIRSLAAPGGGDTAALEAQVASLTSENDTLSDANAALTSENATLTAENADLVDENATLTSTNATLTSANAALTASLATAEALNEDYATLSYRGEVWTLSPDWDGNVWSPDTIDPVSLGLASDRAGTATYYVDCSLAGTDAGRNGSTGTPWGPLDWKALEETASGTLYAACQVQSNTLVVVEFRNTAGNPMGFWPVPAWSPLEGVELEYRAAAGEADLAELTAADALTLSSLADDGVHNGVQHYSVDWPVTFADSAPYSSPYAIRSPHQMWIQDPADGEWVQLRQVYASATDSSNLTALRAKTKGGWFCVNRSTGKCHFSPYSGNWYRYDRHFTGWNKRVTQTAASASAWATAFAGKVRYNARAGVWGAQTGDGSSFRHRRTFRRFRFFGGANPKQTSSVTVGSDCSFHYCTFEAPHWGALRCGGTSGSTTYPDLVDNVDALDGGPVRMYNFTVAGCRFKDCGIIGINAVRVVGHTRVKNHFLRSAFHEADTNWEGGDDKLTSSSNVVVWGNQSNSSFGRCVWPDYINRHVTISDNAFLDAAIGAVRNEINENNAPVVVRRNKIAFSGWTRTEGNLGAGIETCASRTIASGNWLIENRGGFLRDEDSSAAGRSTTGLKGWNSHGSEFAGNYVMRRQTTTGKNLAGSTGNQDGPLIKDNDAGVPIQNPTPEAERAYKRSMDPDRVQERNVWGVVTGASNFKVAGQSPVETLASYRTLTGSTQDELNSVTIPITDSFWTNLKASLGLPAYNTAVDARQCHPYYLDELA